MPPSDDPAQRFTLIDLLMERGWQAADFNYNGPAPPYCRLSISFLRRSCVLRPMRLSKRFAWRESPTPQELLAHRCFRIEFQRYDDFAGDQLLGGYIPRPDVFPFGQWLRPVRLGGLSMIVAPVSGDQPNGWLHEVRYPALIVGCAFEFAKPD